MVKPAYPSLSRFVVHTLAVLALLCATPAFAAIQTKLSHNQIVLGETLQVEFSGKQADFEAINFDPLKKDFHVGSVARRSFVNIRNGVRDEQAVVVVNLIAKRLGDVPIPALSFGKVQSQPAVVKVVAKQADPNVPEPIFMRLSAEPRNPYVQQQVEVKLQVWMDANYNVNGNLTTLSSDKSSVVKKVGRSKTYRSNHQGRNYNVHEDNYLLYPQNSGRVELKPVTLNGSYIQTGVNRRIAVRKASNNVVLDVRPAPAAFPGISWLPAQAITLADHWSKDLKNIQAGSSIVRTITINARGLLNTQLPDINIGTIENASIYPEPAQGQDQLEARTANKTQKFIVIPNEEGRYTIPEIKVPWWDVTKNSLAYASLPARTITVTPAPAGLLVEQPVSAAPQAQQALAQQEQAGWHWLSWVLLVALLLSLAWNARTWKIWVAYQAGLRESHEQYEQKRLSVRKANQQLRKACEQGDMHAIRGALLDWGRTIWPSETSKASKTPHSLISIAERIEDEGLRAELYKLDQALYSEGSDWKTDALTVALLAYMERVQDVQGDTASAAQTKGTKVGQLEPLHRL